MDCFGYFLSSNDYDKEEKFLTCAIRVNQKRFRWEESLIRVLRTIKVRSNNTTGNLVEVSGEAVSEVFMGAMYRARRTLTLESFHYGQCSSILHELDLQKKEPAPPPPVASVAPDDNMRDIEYPICSVFNTGLPPAGWHGNLQWR